MKRLVLFFVCVSLFTFPSTTKAAADHLVINQIQVAGATADDEFIEIYNPSESPITISGWSVQYKSSSGSFPLTSGKKNLPEAVVPSHGYFLIAHTNYVGSVVADVSHGSFSMSASTGGATIFLVNSTAFLSSGTDTTIVDKVAYGTSAQNSPESVQAPVPPASQVISRTDGADTDNNSVDFSVSAPNPHNSASVPASPIPAPAPAPAPAPSGGGSSALVYSSAVTISEFLPNPDGADSGEEWIELYNSSNVAVDLAGWILDDESKTGSVGSSAYTLPAGTVISAENFLALDLPEGSFGLDNTGGDVLRLLWPNKQVASQIAYTGNAPEDTSYARKDDSSFDWTKNATKGSANKFNLFTPAESIHIDTTHADYSTTKIRINEIFPNPAGTDSGQEWVEVINEGTQALTLHDWILDDGGKDDPIGSSAYRIQSPTVAAGSVAKVSIPAGKFAMNNTGTETIRLFSPDKVLADSVTYSGAKEGLSFSNLGGKWVWTSPSPDAANTNSEPAASVVISEVFPNPSKAEEFIELMNASETTTDLTGWKLKSLHGSYNLSGSLEAGKFLVVKRSQSNIALGNSAKEDLQLINSLGQIVSAVQYEDAPMNQSLARNEADGYDWSVLLTPGEANKFGKSGKVSGATLVRTGNDQKAGNPMFNYFAPFIIIWYIARAIVNPQGETENE
ncbi:MAG: lamin tail domain-containing protein [Candidatus Doudnabacteria bacterium]|nr:lamin tail domain-containing protein [Candidatus Doudnabacteria bacterium]